MSFFEATNSQKTVVFITYNSYTEVIWSWSYIFIAITDCQVRYVALWTQLLRHKCSMKAANRYNYITKTHQRLQIKIYKTHTHKALDDRTGQ